MIFTYQNRESSLNNKYNQKEKSNIIVAGYQAPSSNIPPNRSIYTTVRVGNTEPAKFSRVLVTPQRNPIKHYRRELTHDSYKTSSLKKIIKDFNAPGKTIVTNNTQNDNNFKDEIYPNNEKCSETFSYQDTDPYLWKTISCNSQDKLIRTAQTNMSQKYSPSMAAIRYRRGQTYTRNLCNNPQTSIKNNSAMCSNNQDISFTTNKHTIPNGTTSISNYRRQYVKNYNDNGITIVNNSRCCNKITIKDTNYTKCNPRPKQKIKQTKNICVGLDISSNININ